MPSFSGLRAGEAICMHAVCDAEQRPVALLRTKSLCRSRRALFTCVCPRMQIVCGEWYCNLPTQSAGLAFIMFSPAKPSLVVSCRLLTALSPTLSLFWLQRFAVSGPGLVAVRVVRKASIGSRLLKLIHAMFFFLCKSCRPLGTVLLLIGPWLRWRCFYE